MFGVVTFFSQERGYGFATAGDGGADVWLGQRVLGESGIDKIAVGERVEFDFETGNDGRRRATTLRKV
jgi:cold shock CspA family protein